MRVLIVNKYWKPVGGVEVHAFMLERELRDLGHDVVPFAMADDENLSTANDDLFVSPVDFRTGSAVARARAVGRATFGVQTVRRLRKLLDREHIDVAHVLHPYHQLGTTFLPLLRRRGIGVVLGLHDYKIGCASYRLYSDATGEICTRCLDSKAAKYWAPVAERCWDGSRLAGASLVAESMVSHGLGMYRRNVDVVLVLNELQRRCALAAGFPEERVRFLPHFVEDQQVATPTVERGNAALYVGRLVPEKGVDVLIRAASQAGVTLRIVGDGRDRAELEDLAVRLGGDVQFLGSVPPAQVHEEMAAAGALLVPSVWHEVSPLVIFEAFAAGLPVIGTRVGGVLDLLAEGRGVLVDPGSVEQLAGALGPLLGDRGALEATAAAAKAHADEVLTRSAFRARLLEAYDDARASAGNRVRGRS